MIRFAILRPLAVLALAALVAPACGGDDPATTGAGGTTTGGAGETITEEVTAAQGGVVSDPDSEVVLAIPAGSLGEDTEITLTITAKTVETATEVYAFTPAGLALAEPATLSISTAGVTVPAEKKAVLAVQADGGWGELPGSVEGSGGLQAPVSSLGTFSVILVDAPAGPCDASCMSQSGAECCTTCGCEAVVQCNPVCAAPAQWDCEVMCCFDYDLLMCVD